MTPEQHTLCRHVTSRCLAPSVSDHVTILPV